MKRTKNPNGYQDGPVWWSDEAVKNKMKKGRQMLKSCKKDVLSVAKSVLNEKQFKDFNKFIKKLEKGDYEK